MSTLFLRTYVLLAAVVVLAIVVTHLWGLALRDPEAPVRDLIIDGPVAVHDAFAQAPDDAAALQRLRDTLHVEVRFVPPDAPMPPPVRHRLALGLPALPPEGGPPVVWVPLDDGRVIRLLPAPPGPPPLPQLLGVLLVGLGGVAAWQLRPLDRGLERLSAAATRMGAGDLSVRVRLPGDGPVQRLGARFDEMAERVERLVNGRTELLQAVSHELRTPLQRLRLATELLTDSRGTEAERRALADGVERDLDALDDLVSELLDLGRLEAGAPPRSAPVDVAPLLERAAERARGLGATVDTGDAGGARVSGDAALLTRALGNLAENAARHGRGRVALGCRLTADAVELLVDDDGAGIPETERARIFEPFVRLDASRSRDRGGVGLGLTIVARVVAAHGGSITVDTAPELGGARFRVRLPRADVR